MLFTSPLFLFLFLPLVLLCFYLVPKQLKNIVLLSGSVLFYTWGEEFLVLLMLSSTVIDYSCGLIIDSGKKKLGLYISIIANLSFLACFKYADFAFENFHLVLSKLGWAESVFKDLPGIALPLGISFYTFQTMSYTIDVYRGEVKANRNFIEFATYVTMFPQLVAGPIVRYIDIQKQLTTRDLSWNKFSEGIQRFIIGLAKKVILANTFAAVSDEIFELAPYDLSTGVAWLGIITYSLHIFFDFSGYSDMAIGLGKMFGFDFLENFNYPYVSKSIREFWRRWHISLSSWFRDYVYIPLGGSKNGVYNTYFNLGIVFFVTGFWHGASWHFIVWGMFHGTFIIFERLGGGKLMAKTGPLQHVYTLLIVLIGWVFFKAETLTDALLYLKQMFIPVTKPNILGDVNYFLSKEVCIALIVGIIISMPVFSFFKERLKQLNENIIAKFLYFSLLILIFHISISYIAIDSYNPFIYFRF
jgi:alginate O-acetyltransferase complex protein AlgI